MNNSHNSSRKSLVRLEAEIKTQHGTNKPIDRFDVWKAAHQRKGGQYVNEEARSVEERIVSSLLLTKIILSLTCSRKDDPQILFTG